MYDPRSGTARRRLATAFLIVAAVFASLNSYLVTNHIADKTIAAERRMDQIGDFLATELPDRGDRPIVFACRRGLDVALDTAIKTFHEEYLDRFYLVNCGSPTQVIATQDLYAARGKDLTFPETFTKNPNSYEDLSYGVVAASPKEVVDDLREKTGVYALSLSEDGTLAWVTPDALRDRMKTLGVSFE
ncbi:MAG: hypothetical protein M5R36_02510 [Deltaproteobacteria bacterium]|nr:hypothetical protein [Deltaproteobacteria bacterium]